VGFDCTTQCNGPWNVVLIAEVDKIILDRKFRSLLVITFLELILCYELSVILRSSSFKFVWSALSLDCVAHIVLRLCGPPLVRHTFLMSCLFFH
jgi:hypothetical protein